MKGTSKTREKLGVVEELFTYWVLEDADQELEELEDALIVSLKHKFREENLKNPRPPPPLPNLPFLLSYTAHRCLISAQQLL